LVFIVQNDIAQKWIGKGKKSMERVFGGLLIVLGMKVVISE